MLFSDDVISSLQSGNLAVIPTDTLYGIVCQARRAEAVERLYHVRGRDEGKPCILLLADMSGLQEFGITLCEADKRALEKVWPGKVSVIFDCPEEKWAYLHRGTKTIAFRVPLDAELRSLLRSTGPLLAPSVNLQGKAPAHIIQEAKNSFGDRVTVYVDGGYRGGLPSTVARLHDGVWETLREGAVEL
ncbi:MAG: L-threonylcarbamoyladenylate synthase [Candidatus Moraniibacteriota bacterium]